MRVYFVRHGESEGNAGGIHQFPDTPLSDIGLSQAKILAHRFTDISIDLLISSDYARAQATAAEIGKVIGRDTIIDSDFREVKKPKEIVGKNTEDPQVLVIKKTMKDHSHDSKWHYSDEENPSDVLLRARRVLQKLISLEKENVVVVTHGTFLRAILCALVFENEAEPKYLGIFKKRFHLDNTGLTLCTYDTDNGWKLLHWNDYSHLG